MAKKGNGLKKVVRAPVHKVKEKKTVQAKPAKVLKVPRGTARAIRRQPLQWEQPNG